MFILLHCSGHINTNAGSAAPHLCQTYSPPLHPEDPGHLHPDGHFRLLGEDARPVSWPQDIRDGAGVGAVEIKPFWKAHCACLAECAKALRRMGSQRKNATTGAAQHSQDTGLIRNPRCFLRGIMGEGILVYPSIRFLALFIAGKSWFKVMIVFLIY